MKVDMNENDNPDKRIGISGTEDRDLTIGGDGN